MLYRLAEASRGEPGAKLMSKSLYTVLSQHRGELGELDVVPGHHQRARPPDVVGPEPKRREERWVPLFGPPEQLPLERSDRRVVW